MAKNWWENDPVDNSNQQDWWLSDPVDEDTTAAATTTPVPERGLIDSVIDTAKEFGHALLGRDPNPTIREGRSVMEGYTTPVQTASTDSRAPLRPEVRQAVEAQWDAATPLQRSKIQADKGWIGQVARDRAADFERLDSSLSNSPTIQSVDPRVEARRRELIRKGEKPEFADVAAAEGARKGALPGQEVESLAGLAQKTDFDFDTANTFSGDNKLLNNLLTRGATKGGLGVVKFASGYGEFMSDVYGLDASAGLMKDLGNWVRGKEKAIGERGPMLERNLENVISSIVQQVPLMVAGVKAGSQVIPLAGMALQTFGQEYSDGKAKGQSVGEASMRGGLFSIFEVIGEKLSIGASMNQIRAILDGAPTDELARLFVQALKKEVPGEMLTTTGQFLTDMLPGGVGLNQDAKLADFFQQQADTFVQTILQTSLMGGAPMVKNYLTKKGGGESPRLADIRATEAKDRALAKFAAFRESMGQQSQGSSEPIVDNQTTVSGAPADRIEPTIVGPMREKSTVNFTEPDSPSAQVGLTPIVVPVPTTTQEATDVSTISAAGAATGLGGIAGGDQFGGGLGLSGSSVDVTGQLRRQDARGTATNAEQNVAVESRAGEQLAGIALPKAVPMASDADLLARIEGGSAAAQESNANAPAEQWFGRKGDGYITETDAKQALPGRQRMFPELSWEVEQMPSGKYRLAGYEQNVQTPTKTSAEATATGELPTAGVASPALENTRVVAKATGREGYDTPIELDAAQLKSILEKTRGTSLVEKPAKLEAWRNGTAKTDPAKNPIELALTRDGRLDVNDGRHRIALAAERGEKVTAFIDGKDAQQALAMFGANEIPVLNQKTGTSAAAPIVAPTGKPFSTEKTAAVYAQQNGITGYSTVRIGTGYAIQPQEPSLGTQATQAIQTEAQGQEIPVASTRQPDSSIDLALQQAPLPDTVLAELSRNPGAANTRAAVQAHLDKLVSLGVIKSAPKLGAPDADSTATINALGNLIGTATGLGQRVVPFKDVGGANGFAVKGIAFVNTWFDPASVSADRTTFHEIRHIVEQIAAADTKSGRTNTPAQVFTAELDSIFDDIKDEGKRAYVENFLHKDALDAITDPAAREAKMQEFLVAPLLRSEMVADFLGNRSQDRKFLIDLAQADPQGFEGFVRKWLAVIDNLLAKLKGGKTQGQKESAKVDQYVRDLNKAKMVARDALIEFRKGNLAEQQVDTKQGQDQTDGVAASKRQTEKTIDVGGVELALNDDGTVTLYHHTSSTSANLIRQSGLLRSKGEPDVYLTTRKEADTGYGDTAVAVRVDPAKLQLDDEFPDGRADFRMSVGKPGGAARVSLEKVKGETGTAAAPATPADQRKAKVYERENGILPYTSAGQIEVPVDTMVGPLFSIKQEGKYGNHPLFDIPVNKNGTVTLYYPATNAEARRVARDKTLRAAPGSTRIYLTNESSAPKVMTNPGNIEQELEGANVLVQIDPSLLQLDMEHSDGRKDFFIPLAEGKEFFRKMRMTRLFTQNAPRTKALTKDTKLTDLERRISDGVEKYLNLTKGEQRISLKEAKATLKREHNVTTLLGVNGKLEKTNTGGYGLNNYDGKDVKSMGLGLASAQKINENNLSTCPKSAICESLCLGETSGQNQLYGGDGDFKSGPRLSQYLKTEAMVVNPEAFAVVLHSEIAKLARDAKKEDYQATVRLNVTSDFRPQTFAGIIKAFPEVMFYDYTKLPSKSISDNHHLTYSSTGVSQLVAGRTVVNSESNWNKMTAAMQRGDNVAMAFSDKNVIPKYVVDEKTGEKFQVWNGDNYDARFLDPKPGSKGNEFGKGMIVGLTNKDRTRSKLYLALNKEGPDSAAPAEWRRIVRGMAKRDDMAGEKYIPTVLDWLADQTGNLGLSEVTAFADNPAVKHGGFFIDYNPERDGDTVVIKNQDILAGGIKFVPINEIKTAKAAEKEDAPAFSKRQVDKPLTERQFYSQYVQHIDLRARASGNGDQTREAILRDGFKKGVNVNAFPPYRGGEPTDIMSRRFMPRAGDVVYLAPRSAWKDKPNGVEIQDGWKPEPWEVIKVTKDAPSMYQEYLKAWNEYNEDAPQFSKRQTTPLGFYSALADGIEKINARALPPSGWKDAIKGLINKGQVKADEIEWSGLNDWLDLQEGKVTKEQVGDYLRSNGVQVEETVLGEDANLSFEERVELKELRDLRRRHESGERGVLEPDDVRRLRELEYNSTQPQEFTPKYGKYTLPGGENYREVLLTLPESKRSETPKGEVVEDGKDKDFPFAIMVDGKEANRSKTGGKVAQEILQEEIERVARKRSRAKQYKSSHWDQPNILAHIRVNDRTDADGKRVLFVEEIQSDWGQDAASERRKEVKRLIASGVPKDEAQKRVPADFGFASKETERITGTPAPDGFGGWKVEWSDGTFSGGYNEESARAKAAEGKSNARPGLPRAPFVQATEGWLNLALKRVMIMAAEGGYDKVAFVNGEQSANRYDLSKQVDEVSIYGENTLVAFKNGARVFGKDFNSESELADMVGKEVANKLLKATPGKDGVRSLKGQALKVGGEGMKTFYDTIVPTALKKLLPKVGGKQVQTVNIQTRDNQLSVVKKSEGFRIMDLNANIGRELVDGVYATRAEAEAAMKAMMRDDQPGFDVTDAMREKVSEGLPMFSRRQADVAIKTDDEVVKLFADVQEARGLKAVRAKEAMSAHPMGDQLVKINNDFYDILEGLEDAGLIEINC